MKITMVLASMVFISNVYADELQYNIKQVGIHDPNYAFHTYKINNQGLILGQQKDPTEHRSPFYSFLAKAIGNNIEWDPYRLPYNYTSLNNLGHLVGASLSSGVYIKDEFNQEMTFPDITLDGSSIGAADINDSGQVVGHGVIVNNSQQHAYIASSINGVWNTIDLGTLGGGNSYAKAVNNTGIVVGHSEIVDASTINNAFAASNSGNGWNMINLGTLGGDNSYAIDINNSNQVVGFSDHPDGSQHAFLASQSSTGVVMTDLGLARDDNIYQNNTIQINDSGYIVWNDLTTAYLYANGQKYNLMELILDHAEWESVAKVTSISNAGQIIGSGKSTPSGDCCAGYVLTPIVTSNTQPPICEAGVDPVTIRAGEGTALWWWSQNTTAATMDNEIGNITVPSNYKWIHPSETTTYTMTAKGTNGATTTCQATIVVERPNETNPPLCTIGLDPQVISAGEGTALWWWSQNGSSANIDNNIGNVEIPSQYKWIHPSETTTFKMNIQGRNGETTSCQTTITVE